MKFIISTAAALRVRACVCAYIRLANTAKHSLRHCVLCSAQGPELCLAFIFAFAHAIVAVGFAVWFSMRCRKVLLSTFPSRTGADKRAKDFLMQLKNDPKAKTLKYEEVGVMENKAFKEYVIGIGSKHL